MLKSTKILSDIAVYMKYARYLSKKNRRETWEEIIERNVQMHIKKFPELEQEIKEKYKYVLDKKVLPSMRGLQFAGKPIEISPNRCFNCAYLPIDHIDAFSEIMFLLLGGTGVGFSVQKHHIEKLPVVIGPIKPKDARERKKRYLVGDSIEGWSDAIKMLVESYFHGGKEIEFDFRDIRVKGARLITSGGKAPGPQPLKDCIHNITKVFETALEERGSGIKLKSIEIHDITCFIANAVLSGGIRRAALISLFSFGDEEMLSCKFGKWYELNPQRGRANNSVVIVRPRVRKRDFFELWEKIKASGSGEPGIFFTNDKDWLTNPCLTKDAIINTSKGPKKIEQLLDNDFEAIVNGKKFNGKKFFWTGYKEIFEVDTVEGFSIKATENHKIMTENGWKEVSNLFAGDKIVINNHRGFNKWEGDGNFDDGYVLGLFVGDGSYNGHKYSRMTLRTWEKDVGSEGIREKIKDVISAKPKEWNCCKGLYSMNSPILHDILRKFNQTQNKMTENYEFTSSDFHRGFLSGFFDADGCVIGNQLKGVSVRLSQSNYKTLKIVQKMLLRLGIYSKIYKNRLPEEMRLLPNGKGGYKEYFCKACHELVIANDSIILFDEFIGFFHKNKKEKLKDKISSYKRTPNKTKFFATINSITSVGFEDVYDTTIDEIHAFDGNGLYLHNCCEISLRANQFCNLTTINVSNIETQEELNNRVLVASFIGTLQASYTNFHYLRDIWQETTEKESLLGISMTGIASKKILSLDLKEAAKIAKEENERVARLIGINKAARVTAIKPEGTSSLVLGSSSGIHAWHSKYYMRRVRVGKNESIYTYLALNHPELVEDEYFKPETQAVISIPIKSPKDAILRSEPALDLLERAKKFSTEWIVNGHRKGSNTHNVSVTASVKEDEWDRVGNWMWENRSFYNGITVLPYDGGSYVQAPFEECSKEKYGEMFKKLELIDLKNVFEDDDNTNLTGELACSGGACTVV